MNITYYPGFFSLHAQGPRPDHPPHDGHSPANRERSSSLQGMDMASLPPRKRPWHDGPGTSDHREMDAPGGPPEERGKGKKPLVLKTLGNTGTFFNSRLIQNSLSVQRG